MPESLRVPSGLLLLVDNVKVGAGFDSQADDDDDEDRESIADRAYNRLVHYIYDRFPHSQSDSAPYMPLRCEFEEFFATSESASSAKRNLALYPRVNEIT